MDTSFTSTPDLQTPQPGQEATQSVSVNSPSKHSNVLVIFLFVLVVILSGTTSLFAYQAFRPSGKTETESVENIPEPTEESTQASIPPTEDTVVNSVETLNIVGFQNFLRESCVKSPTVGEIPFSFHEEVTPLPISLEASLLNLEKTANSIPVTCISNSLDEMVQGYLAIGNTSQYFLYDDYSLELGHGGPPFIGNFGTEVYNNGPLTLMVYLSGPHGGPGFINDFEMHVRAIKRFNTQSQQVYFSANRLLFEPGNSTFLEAAKPYTKAYEAGSIEVDGVTYPLAILDKEMYVENFGKTQPQALQSALEIAYPGYQYLYFMDVAEIVGQFDTTSDFSVKKVFDRIYPTTASFIEDPQIQQLISQMESVRSKN